MKGLQAFCNLRKSSPGTTNKRLRQVKLNFLWFVIVMFCFITLLLIFISIWAVLYISNTLEFLKKRLIFSDILKPCFHLALVAGESYFLLKENVLHTPTEYVVHNAIFCIHIKGFLSSILNNNTKQQNHSVGHFHYLFLWKSISAYFNKEIKSPYWKDHLAYSTNPDELLGFSFHSNCFWNLLHNS